MSETEALLTGWALLAVLVAGIAALIVRGRGRRKGAGDRSSGASTRRRNRSSSSR